MQNPELKILPCETDVAVYYSVSKRPIAMGINNEYYIRAAFVLNEDYRFVETYELTLESRESYLKRVRFVKPTITGVHSVYTEESYSIHIFLEQEFGPDWKWVLEILSSRNYYCRLAMQYNIKGNAKLIYEKTKSAIAAWAA
jgi:hypothetical protein